MVGRLHGSYPETTFAEFRRLVDATKEELETQRASNPCEARRYLCFIAGTWIFNADHQTAGKRFDDARTAALCRQQPCSTEDCVGIYV